MAKKEEILLGYCPIGKFVFSHEDAKRYKKLTENKLKQWKVNFVGIDEVVKDGIIRSTNDIEPVVNYFKTKKVDALFMPHCNFGTEHAVGLIARECGVPVLIWGPRDEKPLENGTRLRDSLCGMFASTKILHKLNIPYMYLENSWIDEPIFKNGIDTFLKAVNVANVFFNGIKIGHIGQRIDFFWSTIINENELLEKFKIEVLPIDIINFITNVKKLVINHRKKYLEEIVKLKRDIDFKGISDENIINILAVRDQMLEVARLYKLDGIAIQSFMSIIEEMGAYVSLAIGMVSEVIPVGMESDIHGVISNILLKRASFDKNIPYLVDLTIRHPENDNAVLLWHSAAPLSLKHPDVRAKIGKHWILQSPYSGMTHFRLKDGEITVLRFDEDHGSYKIAVGEGKSTDGPFTLNNYVWIEVNDWSKWEKKLMYGPFIHHIGMIYGNYMNAIIEAGRLLKEKGIELLVL